MRNIRRDRYEIGGSDCLNCGPGSRGRLCTVTGITTRRLSWWKNDLEEKQTESFRNEGFKGETEIAKIFWKHVRVFRVLWLSILYHHGGCGDETVSSKWGVG